MEAKTINGFTEEQVRERLSQPFPIHKMMESDKYYIDSSDVLARMQDVLGFRMSYETKNICVTQGTTVFVGKLTISYDDGSVMQSVECITTGSLQSHNDGFSLVKKNIQDCYKLIQDFGKAIPKGRASTQVAGVVEAKPPEKGEGLKVGDKAEGSFVSCSRPFKISDKGYGVNVVYNGNRYPLRLWYKTIPPETLESFMAKWYVGAPAQLVCTAGNYNDSVQLVCDKIIGLSR